MTISANLISPSAAFAIGAAVAANIFIQPTTALQTATVTVGSAVVALGFAKGVGELAEGAGHLAYRVLEIGLDYLVEEVKRVAVKIYRPLLS